MAEQIEKEPRRFRLIAKVDTLEEAKSGTRHAFNIVALIALAQTVIIFVMSYLDNLQNLINLFDPVFMIILIMFIRKRLSRTAAVILSVYFLYVGWITFEARLGISENSLGGRNVVFAIIAIYAAYLGLISTFKFHKLSETKTLWKRTIAQSALIIIYSIVLFVVVSIIVSLPFATELASGLSEETFGVIVLIPSALIILAGALGYLPGTHNSLTVAPPTPIVSEQATVSQAP